MSSVADFIQITNWKISVIEVHSFLDQSLVDSKKVSEVVLRLRSLFCLEIIKTCPQLFELFYKQTDRQTDRQREREREREREEWKHDNDISDCEDRLLSRNRLSVYVRRQRDKLSMSIGDAVSRVSARYFVQVIDVADRGWCSVTV